VKRDPEHFGGREMDLVYIARRLKDALRLEEALTAAGVDYAVETGEYLGGVIFKRKLTGAFFYVVPEALEAARQAMTEAGFEPFSG
jgi:flavin-dependent dehydrogenase